MEIGFSLGSNLEDRKQLLIQAKEALLSVPQTRFVDQSSVYETTPVDVKAFYLHMAYLNCVVIVESTFPLFRWPVCIERIERRLGRKRDKEDRNAPRTIDIDIIYAGQHIINNGGLEVPHPRWAERRFVAQPLCNVRPDLVLPRSKRAVSDVLALLPEDSGMSVFDEQW